MSARQVSLPDRFLGGRSLMMGGAAGGLVLVLATFAGLALGPEQARHAMFSYLVSFAYWGGISMASLLLLMIFHAFGAKWMVVLRRPLEAMATTVALFAVLFIPIILGMKHLYVWVDPPADLGREALKVLAHKRPYLNQTFFIVRAAFYFLCFIVIAGRLFGWSTRQDESGAVGLTRRQRLLGTGALPFMALVFTFAGFDWLMSLNPLWFSTIFGVYYFAGSFVSVFSLLAIAAYRARGKNQFGDYVNVEHIHNVGKLMLSFTAFWGYIAFSQFMLIWIANLPEEIPFFMVRFKPAWVPLGVILIFGQFFIPFGALLSRSLKRDARKLAGVALFILAVHYVDIYWLVVPTLSPDSVAFHWSNVTSFLGIGLLAVSFTIWRLRGRFAIPVKDPYLADSLRYRQP
ncbi:MAG TPA: hypothetical protein VFH68_23340 [Polyangia bacterium]|nr:hypothetical protein [Polyangia bacterium]